MMEGLWDIAWERLEHHYGPAQDVPHWLRARRYSEENADLWLLDFLYHPGGTCTAAVAALPFLVELASDVDTPKRHWVLMLVASLARVGAGDPSWEPGWRRERLKVLALVGADEPEVRRHAWRTFGIGLGASDGVLDVLRARWFDVEARLDMVIAAGRFADQEIARWLWERPVDDPQMRLAVAYALKLGHEEFVPGLTGDLSVWEETASFHGGPGWLIKQFGEAFEERPAEHAALLRELGEVPRLRSVCLRNMTMVLRRWRSPQAELLEIAARRLTDPDPEVRYQGVYLIGATRAEEYADQVEALRDDEPDIGEQTVADAVAWALARFGRQVPDLVRRLLPFERTGPGRWYSSLVPSLGQTLPSLDIAALPDPRELVSLLDTEHRFTALRALGRIGTPVPELAPTDPVAAWAWWRCGGDAEEAAAVIEAREIDLWAVRMLGDLGPAATRYLDLLPMDDDWDPVRVATRVAFLAMTGEQRDLVPVCQEVLSELPDRFAPGTIEAAQALAAVGVRAKTADVALASDRRMCCFARWRGFDQDAELREALDVR